MLKLNDFTKELEIELPEIFLERYEEDAALFETEGAEFLQEDYIRRLNDVYGILPRSLDYVLGYAANVRNSEALSLLAFILRKTIQRKPRGKCIAFPAVPNEVEPAHAVNIEMAAYLTLMSFTDEVYSFAVEHGVPERIAYDTVRVFETYLDVSRFRRGREGFLASTYYGWYQKYIDHYIFQVGILNFELQEHAPADVAVLTNGEGDFRVLMKNVEVAEGGYRTGAAGHPDCLFTAEYTECDEYFEGYDVDLKKARINSTPTRYHRPVWRKYLCENDAVLSVHIPRGCQFTRENIDNAYTEALRVFTIAFPDTPPRAIYCASWLMDPALAEMLSDTSRIVLFQSDYLRYPLKSAGNGIFSFVFNKKPDDFNLLPENTTLERKIKERLLDGGYVYEAAGIVPIEPYL